MLRSCVVIACPISAVANRPLLYCLEYVRGVADIVDDPVLTMEAEFLRDEQWTDWFGQSFSAKEEWMYVLNAASKQDGHHAGQTRDSVNDGKTLVCRCE